MPQTKKLTRNSILNAINDKYNLSPFEITSFEEAEQFWRCYLAPIADISPNFFEQVDAEIGLAIMNNWNDNENLNKEVMPLLVKSSIYEKLKGDR